MRAPAESEHEGSRGNRSEAIRVWLLGDFRVSVGSRTIPQDCWRLRKAAALVKLLALAPGHHLHREQIMNLLWPDSGRKAASNSLRKALHAARRSLDPGEGSSCLVSEGESLMLCPNSDLWVDVDAFEEAAAIARRSRKPAPYQVALDMYTGDLLPGDRYEEWAEDRHNGLRQLYLALLLERAELYQERDEHALAIEALKKATSEEPTLEEAHASLMRLHTISSRPEHALAQYERLRDALQSGLGTHPAEATRRLRDEINAGKLPTAPPADAARNGSSAEAKHNLPNRMSSFVGREREMVEVKRLFSMTRLLTLTGTGGSGKTRLSLEVARDLIGTYPDGVWLLELAPLSQPGLVAQEVAGTLGVKERPGEPLADTLVDSLRGKEMLLVLDNCEHLIEAAASLTETLLLSCPRLRVSATSREPLGIAGEVVWQVTPLSLPDKDGPASADVLMRYEAVRLFVDRARQRLPDFRLTQENAQAVARVCRKLNGIPLAIELATARVGALAVEQIAQRLEASLNVLKGTSRSAAPRQQTMTATLDWSHDLLSEDERTFFRRLSVFSGGWMLEAAEEVCSGGGIGREDVLDLLGVLVDKSLVVAGANTSGAVRYGMLEPIRQYAREKLKDDGEADEVQRRHSVYFLALAEEAEPQLWGREQETWLRTLEPDHDNMRAALSQAIELGSAEVSLRLAGALWRFWWVRGYYAEGRRWLSQALKKGSAASPARVKALQGIGWLALEQGDMESAKAATEQGLKLTSKAGIGGGVEAFLLGILGDVARHRGERKQATDLYEASLALYREVGDKQGIAWALLDFANVWSDRGDHGRATQLCEEGLILSKELGSAQPYCNFLISLGWESLLQGNYEQATDLNEVAVAVLRERGHKSGLQYALDNLGWAALMRGDYEQAKTMHEESFALSNELGDVKVATESLEGLACAAGIQGKAEWGARLFGAAETSRQAIGYHQGPEQRALRESFYAAVRSRLDEVSWEAAFAEGRTMTFEEATEYALSEEPSIVGPPASEQSSAGIRADTLSRREEDIAALVARSMTNRQVAVELYISEHTVATHVRRILKKLGLRARAQIGAWLAERPPTADPN